MLTGYSSVILVEREYNAALGPAGVNRAMKERLARRVHTRRRTWRAWGLSMIAVVGFATTAAGDAELLSEAQFAARLVDTVEAMDPDVSGEIAGSLEITWRRDGGDPSTSYLDNAYMVYRDDPASLDDILERYGRSALDQMSGEERVFRREDIVPIIKDRAYIEEIAAMIAAQTREAPAGIPLHYEALNSELVILYANDGADSLQFIDSDDVSSLGIEPDALLELAKGNLRGRLPGVDIAGDATLSMLTAGGNFEASLLLFDSLWTAENFPVKGDIVVFVPARDVVLVTGSEDDEGLRKAREIVDGNEWSYAISIRPFIRVDGAWQIYTD